MSIALTELVSGDSKEINELSKAIKIKEEEANASNWNQLGRLSNPWTIQTKCGCGIIPKIR